MFCPLVYESDCAPTDGDGQRASTPSASESQPIRNRAIRSPSLLLAAPARLRSPAGGDDVAQRAADDDVVLA